MELSQMIISIGKVKSIHMLKVFAAAAHYGSFTASGQRLHMTQSAVSQQIKRLEELVGSELFFRQARGVRLTDQGRLLLQQVTPLISIVNDDQEKGSENTPVIKMAMSPVIAEQWVSTYLPLFRKLFHSFRLCVLESSINNDEHDEADIKLIQVHVNDERFIDESWCFCSRDEMVAVCSPQYLEMIKVDAMNWVEKSCLLESHCHIKGNRGLSWDAWLAAQGKLGAQSDEIVVFESNSLSLQAAKANCGAALASLAEISCDLRDKSLVVLPGCPVPATSSYYIKMRDASDYRHQQALEWLRKSIYATVQGAVHSGQLVDAV